MYALLDTNLKVSSFWSSQFLDLVGQKRWKFLVRLKD